MNENELSIEVKKTVATEIQVIDQVSYEAAGRFLTAIKTQQKNVVASFADSKRAAAEAHKAVCAHERSFLDQLDAAERSIKRKMADYLAIEQRRREEEEARRRAEAESMMELAADCEQSGDTETAAEAVIEAAVISSGTTVAPKAAGISSRKIWRYRITDANAIPHQYTIPNEVLIAAIAKGFKDTATLSIPGVEFYQDTIIAARG